MQRESAPDKAEQELSVLSPFPLTKYCLEPFLRWACRNIGSGPADFDLLNDIAENKTAVELGRLEDLLCQSKTALGLSDIEFRDAFGFSDDLLTSDSGKIHDILAEALLVVDLQNYGFTQIRKLPQSIASGSEKLPNSDFMAMNGGASFAIELKTIRMEDKPKPEPGKLLGDSSKPDWWIDMFRNNAETKINDKNRHALTHHQCRRMPARGGAICQNEIERNYTARISG